jgi:hypothetical protein
VLVLVADEGEAEEEEGLLEMVVVEPRNLKSLGRPGRRTGHETAPREALRCGAPRSQGTRARAAEAGRMCSSSCCALAPCGQHSPHTPYMHYAFVTSSRAACAAGGGKA